MHCLPFFGSYYQGWGGIIMMLLFWVFAILAVVWLVKNINFKPAYKTTDQDTEAEEIVRLRYARGEIDKEKLNEILDNLK